MLTFPARGSLEDGGMREKERERDRVRHQTQKKSHSAVKKGGFLCNLMSSSWKFPMNVNRAIFSSAGLIVPYEEQSFDTVRLNGAWVAFPLKSQNCNEVRRQKKKESDGWEG